MTFEDMVLWGSIGLCMVALIWNVALHACWYVADEEDEDDNRNGT